MCATTIQRNTQKKKKKHVEHKSFQHYRSPESIKAIIICMLWKRQQYTLQCDVCQSDYIFFFFFYVNYSFGRDSIEQNVASDYSLPVIFPFSLISFIISTLVVRITTWNDKQFASVEQTNSGFGRKRKNSLEKLAGFQLVCDNSLTGNIESGVSWANGEENAKIRKISSPMFVYFAFSSLRPIYLVIK